MASRTKPGTAVWGASLQQGTTNIKQAGGLSRYGTMTQLPVHIDPVESTTRLARHGRPWRMKTRYILVGGFLGAGKTTAILEAARRLRGQGLTVGIVSNDQSCGLVDTAILKSHGFATEEISGGCFCCRFDSLVDASGRLDDSVQPDVILAEPVGSCTDLAATVVLPMQLMHGDRYSVAPLTVLVDPVRAWQLLDSTSEGSFSAKVQYIYQKQIEEADVVVVNKCDLLVAHELDRLFGALGQRYPGKLIHAMSARDGSGVDEWLAVVFSPGEVVRPTPHVDYDTYAEGEAFLGWVNVTAELRGSGQDGSAFLRELTDCLRRQLGEYAAGAQVAHLKSILRSDTDAGMAVVNLVGDDQEMAFSQYLTGLFHGGELIINLRAEAAPELLIDATESALSQQSDAYIMSVKVTHRDAFRPGRPTPTHRMAGG